MNTFVMNGYSWAIKRVEADDPMLVDRTGTLTVATTDPKSLTVYLSNELSGNFLLTVLIHELGHCALYSFHFLEEIRRMVRKEYWIEAEEFICNFLADYGFRIFSIAYSVAGDNAWIFIPQEYYNLLSGGKYIREYGSYY